MITVVTVCFNAEDTIEDTMLSVIGQTYDEIEYLIMDGKSQDSTLDIVEKYRDYKFVRIISETDNGLYDAMNKATQLAKGDYIIFLNSGDLFCDKYVLEDMSKYLKKDIVYGNVIRRKDKGDIIEKYPRKYKLFWLLLQGKMVSHQVIFTNINIMRKYGFDENYRITADFNFLVRAVKDKCSLAYIDRDVSIMENRFGISANMENLETMRREDDCSLRENFPFWYHILRPVKYIARKII